MRKINYKDFNKIEIELNDISTYNNIINEKVSNKPGVYFFSKNNENEILYIGKAGHNIKFDEKNGHGLKKRLKASRGKVQGEDILTRDWLKKKMLECSLNKVVIYFKYVETDFIPAYIEALLMQEYFSKNKNTIPCWNNKY